MIRVRRPSEVPDVLAQRGAENTETLKAAYEAGEREFEFESGVYGHKDVKAALVDAQYGKCAFCESKVKHVAHGDVEHFRPKGAVMINGRAEKPGYFWLAYEWNNLLFSCQICNQSYKRNHFPLLHERDRVRSHQAALSRESPLLIDPASEDPAEYIGFRQEVCFPINDQHRARATIDILGLNRTALVEERRSLLGSLTLLRRAREELAVSPMTSGAREMINEIDNNLAKAVSNVGEFAAMARYALAM